MDDILELESRQKIYNLLKKNPGLHLSKIAKLLDLRVSLVEYHLHYLEKHNLVKSDKQTGYKRYLIRGEAETVRKKKFSILRQKNLLKIILLLLKQKQANHTEILSQLDVSPATLSYHLKRLVKNDILDMDKRGKTHLYYIKNPKELTAWLIKYKPYNLLEGFTEIWIDFNFE
jgi:predicted transcriptional regulator